MSGSVLPGPNLKGYVFTEKLGSGSYATVYKAYKKGGTREVVAIKCVQKSKLNTVSTENLLTEIELLKTLRHQHIVELRDFQWDNHYIYLIMEHCQGGDLLHFIQSHRVVSEYLAKLFLQQLASGLQYMRSKNVSHMDLKPQNILLHSYQNPILKIADFGFAHYLIGEIDAPHLRGSPLYMAPEIILKRQYSAKADLWSVGVILYECLFGRAPFASRSLRELEDKIQDIKPIELPYGIQTSRSCRHLLLGLLQRDPDQRMSFEDFFAHPFIDLDHMPRCESQQKAIQLVTDAVRLDTRGDYEAAVNCYCQALSHFIPAIHFESDTAKKEALREKVKEYMRRAEELKQLMKPTTSLIKPRDSSMSPYDQLVALSADSTELHQAVRLVRLAEVTQETEKYDEALHHYESSLETLLKILHHEPKGRRRDLLQSEVTRWMGQAEAVKNYLKVKDLETHDTSTQEEEESSRSSCVLQ